MPRLFPSSSRFLPQDPLFRLLLLHGGAGTILGLIFVAGVLVLDVAGLHSLLSRTGEWVVGLAMLMMGSIITFASVSMGGAIMLIAKEGERDEPPMRGLAPYERNRPGSSIEAVELIDPAR